VWLLLQLFMWTASAKSSFLCLAPFQFPARRVSVAFLGNHSSYCPSLVRGPGNYLMQSVWPVDRAWVQGGGRDGDGTTATTRLREHSHWWRRFYLHPSMSDTRGCGNRTTDTHIELTPPGCACLSWLAKGNMICLYMVVPNALVRGCGPQA